RAFLNVNVLNGSRYEVCADVDDAVNAAAKKSFAAIAVVLSGINTKLNEKLKHLRDRSGAKIILMAQMYEEPTAIRIINSAGNGAKLAEDYLICPVEPDTFYESVTRPGRLPMQRRPEPESYKPTEIQRPAPLETTLETKIRQLERLAMEDDLTGLKNRRYIREFARQIIERAGREGGQVTLLVFDIDDFKRYNDLYGHATGDEILKQAAVLVRHCCRSHDVVGRIGGDEFAVVFWDEPRPTPADTPDGTSERRSASADHPTEVLAIAQRFIKEIEKAELSSLDGLGPEGKGVLTISGGLATFPRDGQTTQQLFQQADKALLEAKRSGKNRIYLVGKPQNNIANDRQF
ncbi:MAG: GGDEF domain-containing protein, partial [Sedimentisphaerales bacterium]|nr:GGDEF domain-containing protein [Sedimentisphaerales bacterium]